MHSERKLLSILALVVVSANVFGQGPVFVDVTAAAFGSEDLIPRFISEGDGASTVVMCGGGAAGDFDRDGDQDIFLASDGNQEDRVYLNDGFGVFTLALNAVSGAKTELGSSVTVGDINSDGFLDVLVSRNGHGTNPDTDWGVTIYMGMDPEEGLLFVLDDTSGYATAILTLDRAWSTALGDYDLDGDLDLAVATYFPQLQPETYARLYTNDGSGFVDDTDAVAPELNGLSEAEPGHGGFAPRFIDMDGTLDDTVEDGIKKFDRYPDLLIAIDFTGSRFFVNIEDDEVEGGRVFRNSNGSDEFEPPRFSESLAYVGGILNNSDTGMGQTTADYNNDGLMDWFYTTTEPECSLIFTHCRLMEQLPGDQGFFTRYEDKNGYCPVSGYMTHDDRWGWAATSIDVDHDGDVDIVATNGFRSSNVRDEPSFLFTNELNEQNRFFRSDLDANTLLWSPGQNDDQQGRALFALDKDNDGDLDVVVIHNDTTNGGGHLPNGAPVLVFENQTRSPSGNQPNSNYLRLFLDTCGASDLAPDGVGTRVEAFGPGVDPPVFLGMDYIEAGSNFNGQDEMSAHFGLASLSSCDIVVYWANGSISMFNVPSNQTLYLKRADLNGSGQVDIFDVLVFQAAYVALEQIADFNGDGLFDVTDINEFLDSVTACTG